MKIINALLLISFLSFSLNAQAVWYDPFDWFGSSSSSRSESTPERSSDDEGSTWYNPMTWFGSSDSTSEPEYSYRSKSSFLNGFEIMAGAEMAYQFGARAKYNINSSYYLIGGAGFNADFLSSLNETVITNLGQVATEDGTFLGQSMKGGVVFDIMAGMNLSSVKGMSIQAGYSYLAASGGGITNQDITQALLPFSVFISGFESEVSSTIHSLRVEANYMWKMSKFNVYGTIGLIKPISSSTSASNIANGFQKQQFENYIDDLITPIFIPTAALWISYPL